MKLFTLLSFLLFATAFTIAKAQVNDALLQGNAYYRQSQFDLAEREYRVALKKDSLNITAKHNLANALYKQRKFEEAINLLQKMRIISNKEQRARSFYNEGVIYSRQKDLEKSIESYKEALRNNYTDQEARENLQKALLELRKQKQEKQMQEKQKKPLKMSSKMAERQLEQLQKKEEEIQKRLQKKGQGSSMQKDW